MATFLGFLIHVKTGCNTDHCWLCSVTRVFGFILLTALYTYTPNISDPVLTGPKNTALNPYVAGNSVRVRELWKIKRARKGR